MGQQTTTYVLMMSGLMLLFYFTGIATTNPLLNLLLSPESMSPSSFWTTLIASIVSATAAIVIGFFSKNLELAAMSVIAPILFGILWSFLEVYNKVASVNQAIALLVFAPLLFLFMITIIDYWRGRD